MSVRQRVQDPVAKGGAQSKGMKFMNQSLWYDCVKGYVKSTKSTEPMTSDLE